MKIIKFSLVCSIAALIGVLLAKCIFGQSFVSDGLPASDGKATRIQIEGGVSGVWLTVERANKTDPRPTGKGGFDPSYTYLLSDFKPLIKKLKNGKWEIQFTAEIAENIP